MADYVRGAFIAYDPGGYPNDATKKRVIPFRFNPEGLSRTLAVEAAAGSEGVQGAAATGGSTTEQAADAVSGTLKETFNVAIRLDFVDRLESAVGLDEELGVLPEISALEDLLYASESGTPPSSDGQEPVQARAPRPTVLFIWGRRRVFPVRIAQMTINETLHNSQLNPIRAEIEVSLELLREGDARGNTAVSDALRFTSDNRRRFARQFLERAAAQNTNILPL